jgi:hypothetical protein
LKAHVTGDPCDWRPRIQEALVIGGPEYHEKGGPDDERIRLQNGQGSKYPGLRSNWRPRR